MLRCIVHTNCQLSADLVTAELQTFADINISTKPVNRELHGMYFFHGSAAPVGVGSLALFVYIVWQEGGR